MEKPDKQCPVCYHSLVGAQIPETDPPEYYSRLIGVEISDIYDGYLFWECPFCESRFHRFRQGSQLWHMADPYVRKLSVEEIKKAHARLANETVQLSDDVLLVNVHSQHLCAGEYCAIHNPSDHPMNKFPREFANGLILRACPHGVWHPDPDTLSWVRRRFGLAKAAFLRQHDCCGAHCCDRPVVEVGGSL